MNIEDERFNHLTYEKYQENVSISLDKISNQLDFFIQLSMLEIYPRILKSLSQFFKSSKQIRAYSLLNGTLSTRDIAKIIGVSHQTVANWCNIWEKNLLLSKESKLSQFKSNFSLLELLLFFGDIDESESHEEKEDQNG